MNSKDFYELGEELQKIVQTAIDSKDFKELNETVRATVNDAVQTVKSGVSDVSDALNKTKDNISKKEDESIDHASQKDAAHETVNPPTIMEEQFFVKRPRGNILGGVMEFFGFSSAILLTVVLIGFFALDIALQGVSLLMIPMIVLMIIIALFLFMGIKGRIMRNRTKRFKQYKRILNGREFCEIQELVDETDKRYDFVLKDLYCMIEAKWFLQGHIDLQEKHLIISDKMFEHYTTAMESMKERQKQAKIEAEKMADPKYTEEVRQIIMEGKRFVNHIRECNDAIPGVEISAKMSKLELIVSRIFAQVEKNPAVASEMHQFMTYYLPTTEKLLDAYRELDEQPVQGQNIVDTKNEIEATLDTLNQAFEKLLDSFYKDLAWDVTTDISVLNTMLAKEGLTDDGMKIETKVQ